MQKLGLLLIITAAFAACNSTKTDTTTADLPAEQYLIFGKFFGHCLDECATLYKLEGNQLFADDMARFNGFEDMKFKSEPLPDARTQAAKDLLAAFPQELLNEAETIGCPDCADQGGFALEIRKAGQLRHWRIDTNRGDLPDYLKSYVDQLDAAIERLKQ